MKNEIVNFDNNDTNALTLAGVDELISIASLAQKRIDAINSIKKTALSLTDPNDWSDQNGKPYMSASGAEKIAGAFNISWMFSSPEPEKICDSYGHYTYIFRGTVKMGNREITIEGSRSSRDKFFNEYIYVDKHGNQLGSREEVAVEKRTNERDVRMSALTNFIGNAITRILGVRNLTWDDLEQFGNIKRGEVSSIKYEKRPPRRKVSMPEKIPAGHENERRPRKLEKAPQDKKMSEYHVKLGDLLGEIYFGDIVKMSSKLRELTAWTDKEGKLHEGKDSIKIISEKMAQAAYGKLKKEKEASNELEYPAWLEIYTEIMEEEKLKNTLKPFGDFRNADDKTKNIIMQELDKIIDAEGKER